MILVFDSESFKEKYITHGSLCLENSDEELNNTECGLNWSDYSNLKSEPNQFLSGLNERKLYSDRLHGSVPIEIVRSKYGKISETLDNGRTGIPSGPPISDPQ